MSNKEKKTEGSVEIKTIGQIMETSPRTMQRDSENNGVSSESR